MKSHAMMRLDRPSPEGPRDGHGLAVLLKEASTAAGWCREGTGGVYRGSIVTAKQDRSYDERLVAPPALRRRRTPPSRQPPVPEGHPLAAGS